MTITFFCNRLNQHQAPVADEFFRSLGTDFHFVETSPPNEQSKKGSLEVFSHRPYLIKAWENEGYKDEALDLALNSQVAVFGASSLDFETFRLRNTSLLSFEMSERWLKRGFLSFLSPNLLKYQWLYHTLFYRKPLYKLCASGYAARDQYLLKSFEGKCFKWGYFVNNTNKNTDEIVPVFPTSGVVKLLWCARFLKLKHPELAIKLVYELRNRGYNVLLDMIGDGPERIRSMSLVSELKLNGIINFWGAVPNDEVLKRMCSHDIFLFTSDKREGWGVVANEAMLSGCLLVASDAIGSSPYLIKDGVTGCTFKSGHLDDLVHKVQWILNNRNVASKIRQAGHDYVLSYWSPANAVSSLLKLINHLSSGDSLTTNDGPCSIA